MNPKVFTGRFKSNNFNLLDNLENKHGKEKPRLVYC